jgi:D-alanine-D-alanine ligase
MPARIDPTRYRGILNLAERAAHALDTCSAVRVDLLVTEGQNEYVLEVNTLPGMTETSLLPKIAAEAGFDFDTLCGAILDRARLHTGAPRKRDDWQVVDPAELIVEMPVRRRSRGGRRAQSA